MICLYTSSYSFNAVSYLQRIIGIKVSLEGGVGWGGSEVSSPEREPGSDPACGDFHPSLASVNKHIYFKNKILF